MKDEGALVNERLGDYEKSGGGADTIREAISFMRFLGCDFLLLRMNGALLDYQNSSWIKKEKVFNLFITNFKVKFEFC